MQVAKKYSVPKAHCSSINAEMTSNLRTTIKAGLWTIAWKIIKWVVPTHITEGIHHPNGESYMAEPIFDQPPGVGFFQL
ncbi:hypothetical protein WA026_022284 [Henosepilachna vigintioctopunctata]|uniref:Uncharacterized protein n=1 Tax=Henosepilachna vigintioctopunctata TaxID=420089 RepID=A0AAW1VHX3_9CUCU